MPSSWRDRLDERDVRALAEGGYGGSVGLSGRVALAVIDVTYGFVDHRPLPLQESIKRYPSSCGEAGWAAIGVIRELLEAARLHGLPVIYSGGVGDRDHANKWKNKHRKAPFQPDDAYEIVAEISPREEDLVVRKSCPSMFFETSTADQLRELDVSSLIITGGTTSGCVRATVVDAFSHDFLVTVTEDGVFDRAELSHAVSLFDMDQKYADVVPSSEVLQRIATATDGWLPDED